MQQDFFIIDGGRGTAEKTRWRKESCCGRKDVGRKPVSQEDRIVHRKVEAFDQVEALIS